MTSRTTILSVVYGIMAITLVALGGVIWLSSVNQAVPDTLTNIVVAGLAALTGILASTRSGLGANEKEPSTIMVPTSSVGTSLGTGTGAAPQEVTVVNTPAEAVPVDALPVDNTRRP